ncbi:uncharacterized protein L201_005409 [Kwoniella dendrophila CBS 6074]|uniref:HMG box domain-containing protein n=1 Tax=Kwoniella dendrophila CBS 6074 TaxID=1295534 RepID=A0AAX4K046_9TREE
MDTPWTVDGFVDTPDMMINDSNDYFGFNPITPKYQQNQSFTHPGYPMSMDTSFIHQQPNFDLEQFDLHLQQQNHNQNQNQYPQLSDHILRSSSSNLSLRSDTSHRSSSSISSFNGWSTVDDNSSEVEDSAVTSLATSFSSSISPSLIGGSGSNSSHNTKHGKVPSLSINPNLFKPNMYNTTLISSSDDNGMEMLETAKPTKSIKGKKEELLGESPQPQPKARSTTNTKNGKKERAKKNSSNSTSGSMSNSEGGKKVSHARKQTADHIPRPRNAFILFRKHVVDSKLIPASVEMRHQNVSIITAKMWSEAPPDQKAHFNELAKIEKEEHMKKYPGYRYQPVYRRTNVIRRRVRKDEAEEQKCKSVAELLIKGKSGEDLENEIKEKISKGIVENTKNDEKPLRQINDVKEKALRAQARQQSSSSHESGDWSDISSLNKQRNRNRSVSTALSIDTDTNSRLSLSRKSSYYPFELDNEDDIESSEELQEHDFSFNASNDQISAYGYGLAPSQIQGFAHQHQQQQQQQQYVMQQQNHHQSQGIWNTSIHNQFEEQNHQNLQNFTFPSSIKIPTFSPQQVSEYHNQYQPNTSLSSSNFPDPSSTSSSFSQNFFYPQPADPQLQLPPSQSIEYKNEFHAFDTALPFSPSVGNFSFQQQQDLEYDVNQNVTPSGTTESSQDSGQGIYEFTLPNNNFKFSYTNANDVNDQISVQGDQPSWDSNNYNLSLLPPSSGVPLENLPFDDHFMLGDFEAALAHADDGLMSEDNSMVAW